MELEFQKVSNFSRGTLTKLLEDAYSFDPNWKHCFSSNWEEFDQFFYENLQIADQCGFITTLEGKPIGLVSWDPRNCPEYIEVGHNCILSDYKGNGYGRMQLSEAVKRMKKKAPKKIVVTTNGQLVPAQRMYESVGFIEQGRRENKGELEFSGGYIDYAIFL